MNATAEVTLPPYVECRDDGGVRTLTLNRGERYNPLSLAMIDALAAALGAAGANHDVRVVVLAAHGNGYSAGHDLKEMRA
ncbi:MAG: enoyl-CoA hydratase-related protein, partial [Casimicrobiaceae bacterium]